jgi:hypothetical protein
MIKEKIYNFFSACRSVLVLENIAINLQIYRATELVFVDLLRSPGNKSQHGGPVRHPYLSYRPARLHWQAESVHWNRLLGSINVYKYGLCLRRAHPFLLTHILTERMHNCIKTQKRMRTYLLWFLSIIYSMTYPNSLFPTLLTLDIAPYRPFPAFFSPPPLPDPLMGPAGGL